MDSPYTIVVPDIDLLTRICGTNDSNLRLIEQQLGVSVFTCGNEISVGDGDPYAQERFKVIIDRILDEALDGSDIGSDLVSSIILDSREISTMNDTGLFESSCIQIPGAVRSVYPKSRNQAEYIKAMREADIVICPGPAGSGKTFLAIAEALRVLQLRGTGKLVLTRPVVEAGENLGFLPGDFEQKIAPYLRPLFDAMDSLLPRGMSTKLCESGIVEVAPLAYMRGRTLDNSILILDEAQNTTREQMKMFLTRMGQGSKIFVAGDISQTDLPSHIQSGLSHAVKILDGIEGIRIIRMNSDDIVRNPLVRKIVQAYENYETER